MNEALEVFLDALKDSAIIFGFVFVFELILSFVEVPMKKALEKGGKVAPLFGSLFGLVPQCGTSVLGADLYLARHITMGTLVALFLSCSDEALILLIADLSPRSYYAFALVGIKLVIGFLVGFLVDVIRTKQQLDFSEEVDACDCHHHHDISPVHRHLLHPLFHSLELFAYVLVINVALGYLIYWIGLDTFRDFLLANRYLTPLFAPIIGVIPNCSSSILLTELFLSDGLSFGALLGGLLMNSGLGLLVLLKSKGHLKEIGIILLISFLVSVASGYIYCLIFGF